MRLSSNNVPLSEIVTINPTADAKIFYSQLGEDAVVEYVFEAMSGRNKTGFFIDVGAHHPRRYSTTMLLYQKGWTGINIDANETAISLFLQERPKDISIFAGVAENAGNLTYYMFNAPAVNTLDPDTKEQWEKDGWILQGTKQIEVLPLSQIVAPHLHYTQKVDYLNIDIEGFDLIALKTYDFKNYAPSIISIEIHGLDLLESGSNEIVKFLTRLGYKLIGYIIITAIFAKM